MGSTMGQKMLVPVSMGLLSLMIFTLSTPQTFAQTTEMTQQDSRMMAPLPVSTQVQTSPIDIIKHFSPLKFNEPADVQVSRPLYVLLQWGHVNNFATDSQNYSWKGSVSLAQGQVSLIQEVGLEENDKITNTSGDVHASSSSLQIDSITGSDRDAVLLRITPDAVTESSKNEPVISFIFNGVTSKYSFEELYNADSSLISHSEGLTNSQAHQVTVTNIHRLGSSSFQTSNRYFALKLKALEHLFSLEKYLKQMIDEGKINSPQFTQLITLMDQAYRLQYTDSMVKAVDSAFTSWKNLLKEGNLDSATLITNLKSLLNTLSRQSLEEKFKDGVTAFCDVSDTDWFSTYLKFLKFKKIISGDQNGCTFRPASNISRSEFLKMALISQNYTAFSSSSSSSFNDINNHWAKDYITFALQNNFVSGANSHFSPDKPVTRAEAVNMLLNVMKWQSFADKNVQGLFSDTNGHWAQQVLSQAQSMHIIDGDTDGRFRPDEPLTRAEAAKIVSIASTGI